MLTFWRYEHTELNVFDDVISTGQQRRFEPFRSITPTARCVNLNLTKTVSKTPINLETIFNCTTESYYCIIIKNTVKTTRHIDVTECHNAAIRATPINAGELSWSVVANASVTAKSQSVDTTRHKPRLVMCSRTCRLKTKSTCRIEIYLQTGLAIRLPLRTSIAS